MNTWPIKSFNIIGLHGYKDISVNFIAPAQILIAGNGAGKTTVLNALNWILTGNITKLHQFSFDRIECEFSNGGALRLEESDLPRLDGEELPSHFQEAEITAQELELFLSHEWHASPDAYSLRSSNVVRKLYDETDLNYDGITTLISRFSESLGSKFGVVSEARKAISDGIGNCEVIHLPTYRRVEEGLLGPRPVKRHAIAPKIKRNSAKRVRNVINYGLDDVIQRLQELGEEIDSVASLEYRNASATIIDDALSNSAFTALSWSDALPDFPALEQFLLGRDFSSGR